MLFLLVDPPGPRREPDGLDPDDERARRWEPISRQLFVPAAGSLSCFALSPFAGSPAAGWVLTAAGVALCAQFVRVSLRDVPPRGRTVPDGDDRD